MRMLSPKRSMEFTMLYSDEPLTTDRDESPAARVRTWLRYVVYTAATIFVTGYCFVLHPALGIAMLFLAKHILVAILAAALRLPMRDVES